MQTGHIITLVALPNVCKDHHVSVSPRECRRTVRPGRKAVGRSHVPVTNAAFKQHTPTVNRAACVWLSNQH